jgi:DNA repair photolyase
MEYIPAKSILSSYTDKNGWFGVNYNMNIYKGCSHGCIYCDSRSDCYGIEDFDRVRPKESALTILESELAVRRKAGVVGMGAMSDPYNPLEKRLDLTGGALELLDRYRFGAALATKSALIVRDRERLRAIARHSPVLIKMTVTTADDSLCRRIEPRVSVSSDRFGALEELAGAGLFTGILLMPLLPYLEDSRENIASVLSRAKKAGVRFIFAGPGVTLRSNQREWFYRALDREFPGLSDRYRQEFRDKYSCARPEARELMAYFHRECSKAGILSRMPDIIRAYRESAPGRQLALF